MTTTEQVYLMAAAAFLAAAVLVLVALSVCELAHRKRGTVGLLQAVFAASFLLLVLGCWGMAL